MAFSENPGSMQPICRKTVGLTLFISLFSAITTTAQYKVDNWSVDDGLPSNAIFNMYESTKGYLWVATDNGIGIFDGLTFRNYSSRNSEAFHSNQVSIIHEGRDETIWLGTSEGGLLKYKNKQFIRPFGEQEDINQNILSIAESKDGTLYVGTDGGGLARVTGDSLHVFDSNSGLLSDHISALYIADNGTVFIGNILGGLTVMHGDTLINYEIGDGFPQSFVTSIVPGDKNELLLGTNNGLFTFNISAGTFSRLDFSQFGSASRVIRTTCKDDEGNLWIGSQAGLFLMEKESGKPVPVEGFENEFVSKIIQDRESNIWVSSYPGGLHRFKQTAFQTFLATQSQSDGIPLRVVETDRNNLWVITTQKIYRFRAGKREVVGLNTQNNAERILDALLDSEQRLWIASTRGIYRLENNSFQQIHIFEDPLIYENLSSLFQRHNGTICAGTIGRGVYCFLPDELHRITKIQALSNPRVYALAETGEGTMWVGTAYGLNKVVGDSVVKTFTNELENAVIRSLYVDANDVVWFGTHGGGLYRYANHHFIRFSFDEGLESDIIYHIINDRNGTFWLNGNNGIHRAKAEALNNYADGTSDSVDWENYGTADGLIGTDISGPPFQSSFDDYIYFPMVEGVSFTNPGVDYEIKIPPLVHIESILIDFEPVSFSTSNELVLQPDQLNLEINYTGISPGFPENLQFRYKLEGFDQDWVDVQGRRTAFYTNLDHGRYNFKVKAQNRYGVWSETASAIPIVVKAAFYETGIFKLVIILCIALMLWLLYTYRIYNLRKVDAVKSQIAGDLHDEIGSNLGSIVLRSRMLGNREEMSLDDKKNLLEIDQISRETAEAMRDIIWLINPERGKVDDLADKLNQTASTLLGDLSHNFEIDLENGNRPVSLALRRNITLILKEALHNVVKHASASQINIYLKTDKKLITLIVEDNGTGFNLSENKGEGLGLKSMKQRCESMLGWFHIKSEPEKGTVIEVRIPIT